MNEESKIGCLVALLLCAAVIVGIYCPWWTVIPIIIVLLFLGKIASEREKHQKHQKHQKQKSQLYGDAEEVKANVENLATKTMSEDSSEIMAALSEQRFDLMLNYIKQIRQLYDEISKNDNLIKNMRSVVSAKLLFTSKQYENIKDENKDTLKLMMLSDFVILYKRMGYDFEYNPQRIEQLGIIMLSSEIFKYNVYSSYFIFDYLKSEYHSLYVSIIDLLNQLKPVTDKEIVKGHLSTHYLLSKYKIEWADRYVSLLYDFFKILVPKCGELSETEEETLNYLCGLRSHKCDNSNKRGEAESELKSLIGLGSVKESIVSLSNFIKIQQKRKAQGHKSMNLSYHCVFVGNPGTGKTTVARLLASIYKDLGVLKSGHLVEVDRSDLVGEYVGQTAVKTDKVIDSAIDGVLFIDEAYTLATGNNMDYGNEAIATLLKRMEDERERLVVILAGYPENMHHFIDSNPGLQSRFSRYIEFEDYSAEELEKIFELNVYKNDYKLSPEALQVLRDELSKAVINKDEKFGNARYVRNLFEHAIENQANRLASMSRVEDEKLSIIEAEDIPLA